MGYIIAIAVFLLGLALALVSVRKIKGSFMLPLIATLGLMVAGVGMAVNTYMERHSAVSFEGSELVWVGSWLPLVGFGAAVVAMVCIAVIHYSKENATYGQQAHQTDDHEDMESLNEHFTTDDLKV